MTKLTKATRKPAASKSTTKAAVQPASKPPTRLDQLEGLLTRPDGASIAEMCQATGWQSHSVRGAMAGALKKRGLTISSDKIDGIRRYQAGKAA